MGSMLDIHFYGKKLLNQKRAKDALEVFKMNAQKNPKQFTIYAGLTRGYSAVGDYKTALANAKLALPLAPNPQNKEIVEEMIKKLEKGQDVN
jgi:predicted Zn-dependent protease